MARTIYVSETFFFTVTNQAFYIASSILYCCFDALGHLVTTHYWFLVYMFYLFLYPPILICTACLRRGLVQVK